MRAEDRVTAHTAIEQIVTHTAASYGCGATVEFAICELPLVNDALLAAATVPLLHQLGHPIDSEFRSFGSDDFAFYSDHARSLMMFVGTGLRPAACTTRRTSGRTATSRSSPMRRLRATARPRPCGDPVCRMPIVPPGMVDSGGARRRGK